MWNPFKKISPADARATQLHDAELSLLAHETSADYHGAMTQMLRGRVNKLRVAVADDRALAESLEKERVESARRARGWEPRPATVGTE